MRRFYFREAVQIQECQIIAQLYLGAVVAGECYNKGFAAARRLLNYLKLRLDLNDLVSFMESSCGRQIIDHIGVVA